MKRKLILIRHAKSSWANASTPDFDRKLNERGLRDAPLMGEKLKELKVIPDLIIASTAKRARQTAKRIALAVGYDLEAIKWEEKLYHCAPYVFENLACAADDKMMTLFIVAHNPGITDFVNGLSPEFSIDNMPTCGVIGAMIEAEKWGSFSTAERKVFLYEYPGKYDSQ